MSTTSVETYSIVLEATVDTAAWTLTYGTDPVEELPSHLAHDADEAPRLRTLREGGTPAEVRLFRAETASTSLDPAWTQLKVMFNVTVDAAAWQRRWGTHPENGIGPYLAAVLSTTRPMVEELDGSVIFVPGVSGRLLGTSSFSARKVAR